LSAVQSDTEIPHLRVHALTVSLVMQKTIAALLLVVALVLARREEDRHEALESFDGGDVALDSATRMVPQSSKVFHMRGSWLLQESSTACDPKQDPTCSQESVKVLAVFISLSATIVLVICAFSFFREDKEEQITPLCPQLVVKDSELKFKLPVMPLFSQGDTSNNLDVMDFKDPSKCVCKISMDWPDPFRGTPHGVAATVRIHKNEMTLATIVARNVAVLGQGLALCRTGCEIFGFVEPEGNKYLVRHRTGVHLLTLVGNFDNWDIEGVNPVGSKVCSMKTVGDECVGKISQHVDAGLVLCALMATYVHRRLSQPWNAALGPVPLPLALGCGTAPAAASGTAPAAAGGTAPGSGSGMFPVGTAPAAGGEAADAAEGAPTPVHDWVSANRSPKGTPSSERRDLLQEERTDPAREAGEIGTPPVAG